MPRHLSTMPECTRCRHYHVSHDARFPHACRALNFKSNKMPCIDVKAASGQDCLSFSPRTPAP